MTHTQNQSLVYGIHPITSLLSKRAHDVYSLHLIQGTLNHRLSAIEKTVSELQLPIRHHSKESFHQLLTQIEGTNKINHQGAVILIKPNRPFDEKQLNKNLTLPKKEQALWIVLDCIKDPQNFATLLRNAEAVNCTGVIFINHNSSPLTPVVSKVSCGSVELVELYRITNLSRGLQALADAGVWRIGLQALHDNKESTKISDFYDLDLKDDIALVFGSEGEGLRQNTISHCDQLAYLPMLGSGGSLNVSSTSAATLFEVIRQRRITQCPPK